MVAKFSWHLDQKYGMHSLKIKKKKYRLANSRNILNRGLVPLSNAKREDSDNTNSRWSFWILKSKCRGKWTRCPEFTSCVLKDNAFIIRTLFSLFFLFFLLYTQQFLVTNYFQAYFMAKKNL